MSKKSVRFTTGFLKGLRAPESGVNQYSDSTLPGFCLRHSSSDSIVWVVRYRFQGKRYTYKLGKGNVMGLADARKAAQKVLLEATQGVNPAEKRDRARHGKTVAEIANSWLELRVHPDGLSGTLGKSTVIDYEIITRRHVLPHIGKKVASTLKHSDVRYMTDKIIAQGLGRTANKAQTFLGMIYTWAVLRGVVQHNPCALLKLPAKNKKRRRFLSEKEMVLLWQALQSEGKQPRLAILMLLLTGQRSQEVRHMRWGDIDGQWWTIPAEFCKVGDRDDHRVFLCDLAMKFLGEAKAQQKAKGVKTDWVFAQHGKPGLCYTKSAIIRAVVRLCGSIKEITGDGTFHFSAHDLRRTVATHMGRLGVSRDDRKAILNHAFGDVTDHYDLYTYDKEKQRAFEAWGKWFNIKIIGAKLKLIMS